ncbi:unnamed protein product [Cuscuta campestris]|uniref:Uncharacterized protein n=1 Tax=Cuscuta campestris TaxID=132261 RepID=A0A484LZJ4_9ASTE|nr:unnamed protein product [Cuscuta campestris]
MSDLLNHASFPTQPLTAAPANDSQPPPVSTSVEAPTQLPQESTPPPQFDPSRMIGIIKRKALIKDLAAAYHAECLSYCQQLLELQRKLEERQDDIKTPEDLRKEPTRPAKRLKKTR